VSAVRDRNQIQNGGLVSAVLPIDRASEYRLLAETVRDQANATTDPDTREALLEVADIWDRVASAEEQTIGR
jgi:hypothetical protein